MLLKFNIFIFIIYKSLNALSLVAETVPYSSANIWSDKTEKMIQINVTNRFKLVGKNQIQNGGAGEDEHHKECDLKCDRK